MDDFPPIYEFSIGHKRRACRRGPDSKFVIGPDPRRREREFGPSGSKRCACHRREFLAKKSNSPIRRGRYSKPRQTSRKPRDESGQLCFGGCVESWVSFRCRVQLRRADQPECNEEPIFHSPRQSQNDLPPPARQLLPPLPVSGGFCSAGAPRFPQSPLRKTAALMPPPIPACPSA